MGIIRAAVSTVKGSLEDQWLEVVEPYEMDAQTVCTRGVVMRKGREKKGSPDVLSNGSVIHVDENQFMILTDGEGSSIIRRSRDTIPSRISPSRPCSAVSSGRR